ncbi:MAG TPA: GNAT family N-acetyltransferase [Pyrinomonadaceae bacterium]|nr:GNAT family N-acetyltransferase [Pyrinomonadaceae bacterium]
MSITLREVTAEDEAFLLEVYASTRAMELSLVPWSDEQREAFLKFQFEAQHTHYRTQFPEASYQIIFNNTERVGRLYVLRDTNEMRVLDITVMPQHRNAGIGTLLIRDLLTEAEQSGKPVSIWVEQFNPSRTLFQRLGFSKIEEDGYNYLMQWRPNE